MRLLVVGCGSMGLLLSAIFSITGLDIVVACRRPEQVELINEKGVVVEKAGQGVAKIRAALVDYLPRYNFDAAIIAVKAYHVPIVAPMVKHWLRRDGVATSIQNGLGSVEELAESIGSHRVLYMGLYIGARRIGDNRVEYTGGREVVVGPLGGYSSTSQEKTADILVDAFRSYGFSAKQVEDAEPWRWDKLAVNAAINPVTAILGAPNKVVYENKYARELAEAAAREAGIVAEKSGLRLPRDPVEAVIETAKATSSNKSSMLQDIEARRRTEVDYINGAIVSIALDRGVYAPVNYTLYLEVKALEEALGVENYTSTP